MLLGIGTDHVRSIPSDGSYRMRVDALREAVEADRKAGFHPFCVVAQAGSVSTGAIDPLNDLADFCEEQGLWLHVDAAYGGAALLSETHRTKLHGINRADSVCVDPHKWFFVPLECGITLFKSSARQKATFRAKAAYLGQESDWDLKNTNFQLSRQGRALKLWFSFRTYGLDRLAAIVDRNCAMAQLFLSLADASPNWTPAAPADLSIACARFVPEEHERWTQEELDQLHIDLLAELERSGKGFLTPARIGGKAAVRLCIANHRTTEDDIRLLFDVMTEIGLRLSAAGPRPAQADAEGSRA
jgi:aromatic-L-amino-acid decarboxylase